MKYINPVAITESTYTGGNGALIASSVLDGGYQTFVPGRRYRAGALVVYSGVVYKRLAQTGGMMWSLLDKVPPQATTLWAATSLPAGLAAWTSGGSYVLGGQVQRTDIRRVFECIQAHSGRSALPEQDTAYWLDVGPTNKWAAFDQAGFTATAAASPMTMTLQAGIVGAIAFANVSGASSITVTQKDGATTLFAKTVDMADGAALADWWDYFFSDIEPLQEAVIEGFLPYSGTIELAIVGGGNVAVGNIVVGNVWDVGTTLHGVGVGITDYSRKEFDDYGAVNLLERNYSKRMDVELWIPNGMVDLVTKRLSRIRATPVMWFEDADRQSMIVYGFARDWGLTIAYPTHSEVTLSIEGLT